LPSMRPQKAEGVAELMLGGRVTPARAMASLPPQ
jgi:hypothetical protein